MDVHPDLHAAPVATVDAAVGGLGGDHELGGDAVFLMDVLPAETVAVLLLDGSDHQNLVALGDQVQILHDLGAVDRGDHAALLVGAAAAVDDIVGLVALVGVVLPVGDVADAHGVDVTVEGDDLFAGAHPTKGVALRVDLGLVKAQGFHLLDGALHHALLLAALAGDGDQIPEKLGHGRQIRLGRFFDLRILHKQPPTYILYLQYITPVTKCNAIMQIIFRYPNYFLISGPGLDFSPRCVVNCVCKNIFSAVRECFARGLSNLLFGPRCFFENHFEGGKP